MLYFFRTAVASAVLLGSGSAHTMREVSEVRVWLYNSAGAPSSTVEYAKDECSRIFKNAGIEIEWIGPETARPEDFKIVITPEPAHLVSPNALGYVPWSRGGLTAYVIWSRIVTWVGDHRPAFEILGRVMAHEIGHLLLAGAPHSEKGVMRAVWSPDDMLSTTAGTFFFTRKEQMRMTRHLRDEGRDSSRPMVHPLYKIPISRFTHTEEP